MMARDYTLMRIIFARLAKEGGKVVLPVIADIYLGILEDIEKVVDKAIVERELEKLRQRADEQEAVIAALMGWRETLLLETTPLALEAADTVESLIACLKDPDRAEPSPNLEATIKKKALSKATLANVKRDAAQDCVVVDIVGIERGKLFFPIQCMAHDLRSAKADDARAIFEPPLEVLTNPSHFNGYAKWLCVLLDDDRLNLTAYPVPFRLGSTRHNPQPLDEVVVDVLNPTATFEYWPEGKSNQKFIIDIKLNDAVEMSFRQKDKPAAKVLLLRLLFSSEPEEPSASVVH